MDRMMIFCIFYSLLILISFALFGWYFEKNYPLPETFKPSVMNQENKKLHIPLNDFYMINKPIKLY